MLEELCRCAMWDICKECHDRVALVRLKGAPKPPAVFESFFNRNGYVFDWNLLPLNKVARSRKGSIARTAWVWFNENAEDICRGYIKKQHGTIETAMLFLGTFDDLFADFMNYFDERKKVLMEKTENALEVRKNELAKKGEKPQAYGGVANLLKVLSKTSLEQGSSIQTIAKVQYAVCMQAGIFIPDEFLTDVMTATDVMEG
jgi:hypothetical protein